VRTLLAALVLTAAAPAAATQIVMNPHEVPLQWDGGPLGGTGQLTLRSGDTDGTTTHLWLHLEMRTYDWEPSGTITFDVPIVSPGYLGGGIVVETTADPTRDFWSFFGAGPPGGGPAELLLDLRSIPSRALVEVFGSTSHSETYVQFLQVVPIPEPSPVFCLELGLLALGFWRRR